MKSQGDPAGGGGATSPQWMSACAELITTSARPLITMCSALTVISADSVPNDATCSLMTIRPRISGIVWLGWPVTTTGRPLTFRLATWEPPLACTPLQQVAIAHDARASAETAVPATFRL